MSLYEKTVYPRLAGSFATADLERYFTPTAEEIDFADKGARSPGFRLTLLTLLKLFQMLHRFPAPDEIPSAVVNHLRIHLRIGEQVAFENGDAVQRARQYRAIREYTGVRAWCKEARRMATAAGYKAALVMARPTDIMNAIIAALIHARYELPAFSTLERIQGGAHALAHRNICKSVFRKLRSKERKALDRLLVIAVDQRRTAFQSIKRLPQRPSRKHLEESIQHLEWLETLGSEGTALKGVAPSLAGEFAKQARTTDAAELKRFTAPKRYTLLLSLIHNTKSRTRDAIAKMLVNRLATIHKRAKDELRQRQIDQRARVNHLLAKLGAVIDIVATEHLVEQLVLVAKALNTDYEAMRLRVESAPSRPVRYCGHAAARSSSQAG